ncbi:MAG: hypothetical protein WD355_03865 [Balneolaceae bacterium]
MNRVPSEPALPFTVREECCSGTRQIHRSASQRYLLTEQSLTLFLILIGVLLFAGCNEEPFQAAEPNNDRYIFSMFGYLDAAADTQWIRIMPIRDSIFSGPEPIDADVTLENLETGETATLADSLFQYGPDTYARNFWTTMNLEPSKSYLLTARRSDGLTSSVTVTIPDDFPTPLFRIDRIGLNVVEIRNIDRLIDVQTVYNVESLQSNQRNTIFVPQLSDTLRLITGDYQIRFNPIVNEENLKDSYPNTDITARQIFIAVSGEETPNFSSISRNIYALPDGVSNVENGVGYVAGILSKTIPFRTCYNETFTQVIPCPLEPTPWQL